MEIYEVGPANGDAEVDIFGPRDSDAAATADGSRTRSMDDNLERGQSLQSSTSSAAKRGWAPPVCLSRSPVRKVRRTQPWPQPSDVTV